MDQAHEKSGDIGDIRKIHKLQSDLHSTTLRLQAVQRNYDALSRVIRDKQQQAIKMTAEAEARETTLTATQQQLAATVERAEAAERIVHQQSVYPAQIAQLRQQLAAAQAKANQDQQQQQSTSEQLHQTASELSSLSLSQCALQKQLSEIHHEVEALQSQLAHTQANLAEEQREKAAAYAQCAKLRETIAAQRAAVEAAETSAATAEARVMSAERALHAEKARSAQLTEELTGVKRSQAAVSLKLLDLQGAHLALQEQLTAANDTLHSRDQELAAMKQQMLDFEGQALLATQRADLTETARRELDVALSEAQVALEEAVAAKAAAVELEAAAEARARQATDRIAELQQEMEHQAAVAAQQNEELEAKISAADADMRALRQRITSATFNRIESLTNLLLRVNAMEERMASVTASAQAYASALDAAAAQAEGVREEQLQRLTDWEDWATAALEQGAGIQELLEGARQQLASRQLQVRTLEREVKELNLEVLNQERALSAATMEARSLRQQLSEAAAARAQEAATASGTVLNANSAAAQAADEAARARAALQQQQVLVGKLEAELAGANAEVVSLRGNMVSQEVGLVAAAAKLGNATSQLRAVAAAAAQLLSMLQNVDLLESKQVNMAVLQLEEVFGRQLPGLHGSRGGSASSNSRSAGASRPDSAAAGASAERQAGEGGGAAEGQQQGMSFSITSSTNHLDRGLCVVQEHVQMLLAGMRQLSKQYPQLTKSWQYQERKLVNATTQLLHLEQSLGSNYTCLLCMGVYSSPVAVVPCGHTYCKACLLAEKGCRECGSGAASASGEGEADGEDKENQVQWVEVPVLDRLCAKHEVKLGALTALQGLMAERQLQAGRPNSREQEEQ